MEEAAMLEYLDHHEAVAMAVAALLLGVLAVIFRTLQDYAARRGRHVNCIAGIAGIAVWLGITVGVGAQVAGVVIWLAVMIAYISAFAAVVLGGKWLRGRFSIWQEVVDPETPPPSSFARSSRTYGAPPPREKSRRNKSSRRRDLRRRQDWVG
jgi:hypothetical protein